MSLSYLRYFISSPPLILFIPFIINNIFVELRLFPYSDFIMLRKSVSATQFKSHHTAVYINNQV